MYEVPAGGRRYRALELLVKQKRLARTAPVPCIVRTDGLAEEDSLAENVQRAPLHPLDQFRAFLALREKGQSEEEIAAAFFVSVNVVHQRLRLASVSPKLLDVYAEDGMTLEQLMAFTVNPDHARQEQVWEALQRSHTREAYQIRRMLTEGAVRASDKRAQFVGIEAYEAAGGIVLRDLFESDDGGWLQDPALLDRLVAEKLEREAEAVRAEGWKWIEVAPDFPYGHTYGLRRSSGTEVAAERGGDGRARCAQGRIRRSSRRSTPTPRSSPRRSTARLGEIETALEAFEERPVALRSRRGRPRRRLRQHRQRRRAARSSAAMSGPRTSRRSRRRRRASRGATPRLTVPRSPDACRLPATTLAPEAIPASTSRTRTRASGRCPIGS